jgi:hypothetical protein
MTSWTLVPCLVALRDEFNAVAPARDKASDGSIGDEAHADRESDHNPDESGATHDEDSDSKNEVHAIDVDASGPWPATMSMQAACDLLVKNHREGRDDRLQTIIYNSRIATNDNGWKWANYSGSNSHTAHAHFSSEYTTGEESDTSPWGIAEKWEETMDQATFNARMDGWASTANGKKALEKAALADVVNRIGTDGEPLPATDPNPQMGVNSSLQYLAKDLLEVKNQLKDLRAALTPKTTTAAPGTTRTATPKPAGSK